MKTIMEVLGKSHIPQRPSEGLTWLHIPVWPFHLSAKAFGLVHGILYGIRTGSCHFCKAHMAGSCCPCVAHVASLSVKFVGPAREGECYESPTSHITQVMGLIGLHS